MGNQGLGGDSCGFWEEVAFVAMILSKLLNAPSFLINLIKFAPSLKIPL